MDYPDFTPEALLGPLNDVEAKNAPERLYIAGNTDLLEGGGRVAIVGSRKASEEGLRRARKLASLLVARGVTVVSGLAEGIDRAAHDAAIAHGGRTIGVLGTPLDKTYPKANADLQHHMMQEHLVVSQFPVGYPTKPACFPMRNRTMALISDATVIIEATDKSGSLSQAWEALRLGRPLFITQSILDNRSLTWPDKMLEYGTRVLSDKTLESLFELLPDRIEAGAASAAPF